MARRNSPSEEPLLPFDVDLSQIFIGREQQLDQFRFYLDRWQHVIATAQTVLISGLPTPHNRLQGLVVLLHGRGGFGKSTLLKRFRALALEYGSDLQVSDLIDWEFAAQGKRTLFNLAAGEDIDAGQYFGLLTEQLANALGKSVNEFKEYQATVKAVEDAKRQARRMLDGLQRDERYAWLRGLAGESVLTLVRLVVPRGEAFLSNEQIAEKIKTVAGEGFQLGVEQVQHLWARLHEGLGPHLGDYLEQAVQLGQSVGRGLAQFAKRHPLLLCFDTYEEIDEGDDLLRIVMAAAGERVGWVIAGRDNLWGGAGYISRSQEVTYGYKELVQPTRGLSIDFSADGVGDFERSEIQNYFNQLASLASSLQLPPLGEKEAAHLREVTSGVPLALKIAASLYLEKPDLAWLLEGAESQREIVDQMVRRYLLHTRTTQADRYRLYGLALLRRATEPTAILAALDLPASASYAAELTRLQRRYGFVFTRQSQPALHKEVRHFLRLWLLEHRSEPEIMAVNQRLAQAQWAALENLEMERHYANLQTRLEDEQWVSWYLDLAEQQFWLDPAQGVVVLLPLMAAAAIYRRDTNREAVQVGRFFAEILPQPYRRQWEQAAESLIYKTSHLPLPNEPGELKELARLAGQGKIAFPPPLPHGARELEAALWWRLAEANRGRDEQEALAWHQKALSRLAAETVQSEEAVRILLEVEAQDSEQPEQRLAIQRRSPANLFASTISPAISSAMVSVNNVLMNVFPSTARLLGGGEGVQRLVSWAATMRTRPPAFESLQGGELTLLSLSALSALQEVDKSLTLAKVVRSLDEASVAAVAVAGLDEQHLSSEEQQAVVLADERALPLIALPRQPPLMDIERDVIAFVVQRRGGAELQANELYQELLALSLRRAGIGAMLTRLATSLQKIVLLEDDSGRLLDSAAPLDMQPGVQVKWEPVLEAHPARMLFPDRWKIQADSSVQLSLPVFMELQVLAALGVTRLVTPIWLNQEIAGYLSLVAEERRFEPVDRLALGRVAPLIALELAHARELAEIEQRLHDGDL